MLHSINISFSKRESVNSIFQAGKCFKDRRSFQLNDLVKELERILSDLFCLIITVHNNTTLYLHSFQLLLPQF